MKRCKSCHKKLKDTRRKLCLDCDFSEFSLNVGFDYFKKNKPKFKRKFTMPFYLFFLVLFLSGCEYLQSSPTQALQQQNTTTGTQSQINQTNTTIEPPKPPIVIQPRNNSLSIYFLNIQGDATIIQKDKESIL